MSMFTPKHCLLLAGMRESDGAFLWNHGWSQLLKLLNVMSFSPCNGLQNLSQICVVTCLTQCASSAHAPFRNFRKQDRLLFTPANARTLVFLQHVEELLAVFKMLVSRTHTIIAPGITSTRCYVIFKNNIDYCNNNYLYIRGFPSIHIY